MKKLTVEIDHKGQGLQGRISKGEGRGCGKRKKQVVFGGVHR